MFESVLTRILQTVFGGGAGASLAPLEKANEHNIGVTADTDILATALTQSGKDSARYRGAGWPGAWWHYLMVGFFVMWHYIEWGKYVPAARFMRWKKLHPRQLYGRFFEKVGRKTFV